MNEEAQLYFERICDEMREANAALSAYQYAQLLTAIGCNLEAEEEMNKAVIELLEAPDEVL